MLSKRSVLGAMSSYFIPSINAEIGKSFLDAMSRKVSIHGLVIVFSDNSPFHSAEREGSAA